MNALILNRLHTLFGPSLEVWSTQLHAVALSLLAVACVYPLLRGAFHRKSDMELIEWIQLWRCPECSTYNRRATIICSHCDYHLKIGGLNKWIPLKVSEGYKRGRKQLLGLYGGIGWLAVCALAGGAIWKLKLYDFKQPPMQELLASTAGLLLLASLVFLRRTLMTWLTRPLSALMDLMGGALVTAVLALNLALWSGYPLWPPQATPPAPAKIAPPAAIKPAPLPAKAPKPTAPARPKPNH